jgi:molybdenum cofactor synthesis domain-containing protein
MQVTPPQTAADSALQGPTAALLIIGAEVLSGKVEDANGPFLLRALRARGVDVREIRVIGDTVTAIAAATAQLAAQQTFVITTGGIGPTHDDVTMAGIAQAFGQTVVLHPGLLAAVTRRFVARGADVKTLPAAYKRLAEAPSGAEVILGDGTFVPVVHMRNVFVLPGVPSLMRGCFAQIAPMFEGPAFYTRALYLVAHESAIAADLTAVQNLFADVAIGSYPRFDSGKPEVQLTADGRDLQRVQAAIDMLLERLPGAMRLETVMPP